MINIDTLLEGIKAQEVLNKKIEEEKKNAKAGCQCFTCRHRDEPRLVAAYLKGYIEASDWFLNWAKKQGIKAGHISDDDLAGIVAQMDCNRFESACLLEDMPDIEGE